MRRTWMGLGLLLSIGAWAAIQYATKVENGEELRKTYALTPAYDPQPSLRDIKIAILDNGFAGMVGGELKYLPGTPVVKEKWGDKRVELDPREPHGRLMAQTIWAMTGMSENNYPQFYLLNSRGVENTRDALAFAKSEKVHIALFAANFESMGNFDGKGFINKWVSELAAQGTIVIVAAGNNHGMVHNGVINKSNINDNIDNTRKMLSFANGKDSLEFVSRTTEDPSGDPASLEVILSWNDFTDEMTVGTDRDLDLYLEDENNNILGKSQYKQKKDGADYAWARERLEWSGYLVKGKKYRIRISAKGDSNFDNTKDKFRVTIKTGRPPAYEEGMAVRAINFTDASNSNEMMVPGDNPDVITVSDRAVFSSLGPKVQTWNKPDIWMLRSDVRFDDRSAPPSTSFSAAIFAGIAASLKAKEPLATKSTLLKFAGWKVPALERALTWDQASRYLPHVVNAVSERRGNARLTPILRNGSRLILAASEFPTGIDEFFRGVNMSEIRQKRESIEFYLVARTKREDDGARTGFNIRGTVKTSREAYPWEAQNENPASFVQIMTEAEYQKIQELDKNVDATRQWSTPTPDELRSAL